MSMLDVVFGKAPEYNADADPLAVPDDQEVKNLPLHVRQCARRYAALKQGHVDIWVQLQSTQRILILIVVLLLANKVIDLSVITGVLGQ